MPSQETIEKLRTFFSDKPVLRAYIFGSQARNEADDGSDMDILVELDYSQGVGLEFFGMRVDLEKLVGKKVDLVSANGVSKYIKPHIERDKKLVYERPTRRQSETAAHS
jgi:predicted nucleotidyltransferase